MQLRVCVWGVRVVDLQGQEGEPLLSSNTD